MHLLAISLLAILAGTLLLARARKEALGKPFACISWFFIVVGFILFIGFIAGGICRMSNGCKTGNPSCQKEMMMKECRPGMTDGMCCPPGMSKSACGNKEGCMKKGSAMKGCPKQGTADTCKMGQSKTVLPGKTQ
jgi:hypothetical protein